MTMVKHPDQVPSSIPSKLLMGNAYPRPSKVQVEATADDSPKSVIRESSGIVSHSSSSSGSMERCSFSDLRAAHRQRDQGCSTFETRNQTIVKSRSMLQNRWKENPSREVSLEKSRFAVEEATMQTRYNSRKQEEEGGVTLASDMATVKRLAATSRGTPLNGPLALARPDALSAGKGPAMNWTPGGAAAFPMGSPHQSDTELALVDHHNFAGTNGIGAVSVDCSSKPSSSSSDYMTTSRPHAQEGRMEQMKVASGTSLERSQQINHAYKRRSGIQNDSGFGSLKNVEYPSAPAAPGGLDQACFRSDGGKNCRPQNLGVVGQAVKPNKLIKAPPSKWDDAEKWLINSDWQEHPHFRTGRGQQLNNIALSSCPTAPPGEGGHGSSHAIRLFGVTHNVENSISNAEVERDMAQPCSDKIHVGGLELRGSVSNQALTEWSPRECKPILREVEKLATAVNCVHACLERIQPMPAIHNAHMEPPWIAQSAMTTFVNESARFSYNATEFRGSTTANEQMKSGRAGSFSDHARDSVRASQQLAEYGSAFRMGSLNALTKDKFAETVVQTSTQKLCGDPVLGGEFFVQDPKHGRSASMKDAATDITPSVSHRDMGTQMTPLGSSRTSRCPTPRKGSSPARHNTPARLAGASWTSNPSVVVDVVQLENCHRAKLELQGLTAGDDEVHSLDRSINSNWSSREEEEEDIGKSLRHHLDLEELRKDVVAARASAWEEASRSKCSARFKREEEKIQAWEDQKKAKAEAELTKLEVKLEKLRSRTTQKINNKLRAAQKRAEDLRAAARARQLEQQQHMGRAAHGAHRSNPPICSCFT